MDETLLRMYLPAEVNVRYLHVTDSTNRVAKEWARQGAPHGACVIAAQQTAGRGRLGRAFFSPAGGIYVSVILSTDAGAGAITTLAAVAVRRAARTVLGRELSIKWVNDLLLDGRKVCGILSEGVLQGERRLAAVVGIGINMQETVFPEELAEKAGSLLSVPPAQGTPERLIGAIVHAILKGLTEIPAHLNEYRAHCLTLGKTVRFTQGSVTGEGNAIGITDTGALVIRMPEGTVTLDTGEAQVRMADGGYL